MIRRLLVMLLAPLLLAGCGAASSSTPGSAAPATTAGSPLASVAPSTGPGASGDAAATGRAFIAALASGDGSAAEALEDDTMRSAAPAAKLATIWSQLVAQFGAYQSIGGVTSADQPPYTVATVQTLFANATVPLLVTVDQAGQVAGLHVGSPGPPASPSGSSSTPSPAAYVDPAAFSESGVTVGSAPWTLPGTLSMPKGTGPFPAVVLVAGSGPADRDETIGPNKPLRDLAWGLASKGIAVLRYDKRTLVYGSQLKGSAITVKQETTDDAVAAIGLLRSTPGVDPSRVFLVGHSLGAYLAPRIAARVPGELRGIAMLEAPSTPLADLILMQERYLASLGSATPDPSTSAALDDLAAEVRLADSPDLSPDTPASQLPLGIPASYWIDLHAYDPLATAAALDLPMLFTQGGRDYQVPPSELQPWKTALAGRSNVTYEVYPTLDHLLFAGSGPSTPAEYTQPAHVAPQVVADLVAWIDGH